MLRRLKVHRYRNVAPGTELHFFEGHHVLLGPNGGGKTTLLTLISVVLRGDFRDLGNEEFDLEYEIASLRAALAIRVERKVPDGRFDALAAMAWQCNAGLRLGDYVAELRASGEGTSVNERETKNRVDLRRPDLFLQLRTAFAESLGRGTHEVPDFSHEAALRFDEGLDLFGYLLGGKAFGSQAPLQLTLVQRYLQPIEWVGASYHPLHRRLALTAHEVVYPASDLSIDLQFSLAELGEVGAFMELLSLRAATLRLCLARSERADDVIRFTYERFQFRFTRRDGTYVIDEHLSFGQKRLLAFLFYAWANQGPIVADELVDGMHHRWIEHCLKAIGDRQAFLSSQSPLLMDFFGFESAEAVRKCFVLCDLEVQGDRERMRWRSMTAEEADQFFDAYQVGIQHVSEILRDRGLW